MLYTDNEKLIYTAPTGSNYDPLALQRKLIVVSQGKLNDYLTVWMDEKSTEVDRATSEEYLVTITRKAFSLAEFKDDNTITDSLVLSCLESFLRWLEGNANRE